MYTWSMDEPTDSFGRLRSTLACLLKGREMGKSELQKMVYLLERESVLNEGRLALGYRFRHEQFGMFSPDLADAISALESERFIVARQVRADTGAGRKYRLAAGARAPDNPRISSLCDAIFAERGKRGLASLINYAKGTDPFVNTPRGQWMNWDAFLREQCGGAHELLPEAEAELRRLASRKPARVITRAAAISELEPTG